MNMKETQKTRREFLGQLIASAGVLALGKGITIDSTLKCMRYVNGVDDEFKEALKKYSEVISAENGGYLSKSEREYIPQLRRELESNPKLLKRIREFNRRRDYSGLGMGGGAILTA